MGAPAVDAEAQREVLQLAAVARQRANERSGVVYDEAVHAVWSGREPGQYGNVEVLAVVRDEDVVADEGSKLGPHLAKRARVPDVAIAVAVDRARPRRDRPVRLNQRAKPVHDLAPHPARGADLDDAARPDLGSPRLEVRRHLAPEGGTAPPQGQALDRSEQGPPR